MEAGKPKKKKESGNDSKKQHRGAKYPPEVRERLQAVRSYLGMTQREMAQQLSMSPPAYSYIETGHNQISDRVLDLLELKLKVSRDYLLHGRGEMFKKNEADARDHEFQERIDKLQKELDRANAIIDKLLDKGNDQN